MWDWATWQSVGQTAFDWGSKIGLASCPSRGRLPWPGLRGTGPPSARAEPTRGDERRAPAHRGLERTGRASAADNSWRAAVRRAVTNVGAGRAESRERPLSSIPHPRNGRLERARLAEQHGGRQEWSISKLPVHTNETPVGTQAQGPRALGDTCGPRRL